MPLALGQILAHSLPKPSVLAGGWLQTFYGSICAPPEKNRIEEIKKGNERRIIKGDESHYGFKTLAETSRLARNYRTDSVGTKEHMYAGLQLQVLPGLSLLLLANSETVADDCGRSKLVQMRWRQRQRTIDLRVIGKTRSLRPSGTLSSKLAGRKHNLGPIHHSCCEEKLDFTPAVSILQKELSLR